MTSWNDCAADAMIYFISMQLKEYDRGFYQQALLAMDDAELARIMQRTTNPLIAEEGMWNCQSSVGACHDTWMGDPHQVTRGMEKGSVFGDMIFAGKLVNALGAGDVLERMKSSPDRQDAAVFLTSMNPREDDHVIWALHRGNGSVSFIDVNNGVPFQDWKLYKDDITVLMFYPKVFFRPIEELINLGLW